MLPKGFPAGGVVDVGLSMTPPRPPGSRSYRLALGFASVLGLLASQAAPPTQAAQQDCGQDTVGVFNLRQLTLGIVDGFYVSVDTSGPSLLGVWVYEETNGIPDLQRGGSTPTSSVTGFDWCQNAPADRGLL